MDGAWTLFGVGGFFVVASSMIGDVLAVTIATRFFDEESPTGRRIFDWVYHSVSVCGGLGGCITMMASFALLY